MSKLYYCFLSFTTGLANAIFGAGGGILAVDYFKKKNLCQKKAQATALCATYFMSAFSCIYYGINGYFNLKNALIYVPFGIPGALLGSFLLGKLPDNLLRKAFALFIIWAGARMVLK